MMERDRWEEDEEGEEIEWRRRVRSSRGPNASKQGRVQTTNDAMRRGEWKQNRELLSWTGAIDERSVCQNQASLEAEQGAGAVDLRSVLDSLHAGPTRGTLGPLRLICLAVAAPPHDESMARVSDSDTGSSKRSPLLLRV